MIKNLVIKNPKRGAEDVGYESWYPYYAGFSSDFVTSILETSTIGKNACVIDPWNGSGTTTTIANNKGFETYGYDLNPVMVIAARACLLNRRDINSLRPITNDIIRRAKQDRSEVKTEDPLSTWFMPISAWGFRRIEKAIQKILIDSPKYHPLSTPDAVEKLSSIAAFCYVALFRAVRKIVEPFRTSNPTWIKQPDPQHRLRPSFDSIVEMYRAEVDQMLAAIDGQQAPNGTNTSASISVASSCAPPAPSNIADLIISSPPYCTRIDYAVATMPELTVLGYDPTTNFDELRRQLIGTSTVPKQIPDLDARWGITCNEFLHSVQNHESKASKSYYYKNHLQYFDSVFTSISELGRILKPNGACVLVVQDSYYKNIHNDLPKIFIEMAESCGLGFRRQENFKADRNMAGINPEVKKYRTKADATESVLCFLK